FRSGSAAKASGRILRATLRPSRVSRARYTSPMPPAPSGAMISYGPSLVPGVKAILARHYSLSNRHLKRIRHPAWTVSKPETIPVGTARPLVFLWFKKSHDNSVPKLVNPLGYTLVIPLPLSALGDAGSLLSPFNVQAGLAVNSRRRP